MATEHVALLKQGVGAWNPWRDKNPDIRPDERDLFTARLITANRSGVLSGANFSEADLYRANLSGANLTGADLSGANLITANLSGADLSGANLSEADLFRANLSG